MNTKTILSKNYKRNACIISIGIIYIRQTSNAMIKILAPLDNNKKYNKTDAQRKDTEK